MNAINKQPEIPATATVRELLNNVQESTTNLRDAVYALRLIVSQPWNSGCSADMARNAIDWISKKMDEECDAQEEAFDTLMAGEVRA